MPEASHSSLEADVQRAVPFDRWHGLTRTGGRLPVDSDGSSSNRVYESRKQGIADATQRDRDDYHAERRPLSREFRANVGERAG